MVVAEVHQAASDVRASVEKMKSAQLHVKLADQAFSQAKVRYASGVITNLDLLNAETALDEAKLLQLQAIYSYIVSKDALRKAVGEIFWEEVIELNEKNTWFTFS